MLSPKGVKGLDAPVSGGQMGAIVQTLAIVVGGMRRLFRSVYPSFKPWGRRSFFAVQIDMSDGLLTQASIITCIERMGE
jgi:3-hydroxyisobutyrate dehydrogenase-like beta-hydroxyacid dehydrogenase